MGGRGTSSSLVYKWKGKEHIYGDEYETLYQYRNIKFIMLKDGASVAPLETKTKNRIYVTISKKTNKPQYISYYKDGKRYKTIDVDGKVHTIEKKKYKTHTHLGYEHDENGTRRINKGEKQMIAKVMKLWYNNNT